MKQFIDEFFITDDGDVMARSSADCMYYLQDTLGYAFESARGILGLAVSRGFIKVIATVPEKIYSM